jgi:hypothetical protein
VYQDEVLPGLKGHYLVCEPAQNLVHRAAIVRDGTRLRLERVKGEEESEFLASRDAWFHPISLAHTPTGGIAIVDFYREIIEDYSAIPATSSSNTDSSTARTADGSGSSSLTKPPTRPLRRSPDSIAGP